VATVLLGWELGGGLAHAQRLHKVGLALAARGHQPVFALQNLAETWALFRDAPFPVLQAPYWHRRLWRGDQPFQAGTYADVLAVQGFGTVDDLAAMVQGWQQLLDLVAPRLVVCDHSPTLCLAAYGALPVVTLGSWFGMPPVGEAVFPPLVPGVPPVVPPGQLLAIVQEVQRRRRRPVPVSLPAVLAGDRFLTVLPELDGYQAYRRETHWGPLDTLPAPLPAPPGPGFFAYLTAENTLVEGILTALALTGCPGKAYLRSAPAALQERLRRQGLTILDRPAPLGEMLAQVAVIVHHGGVGTAQTALAAGRPQLLLPQHLEQRTNAQTLHRLGVAAFLMSEASPESAARALQQVLLDRRFADQAAACARAIQSRPRRDALTAIVECCVRHLS
jgi:hypothetical protein